MWQLAGWHVGFRIETPPTVDNVARRPDVAEVLRSGASTPSSSSTVTAGPAGTTCAQEPATAYMRAVADRLRSAQHVLQPVVFARMGVGRLHPHADGLVRTTAEATEAARLAATRPENGYFLHVDKLGM
jgi:PucR family transcriptional regulator, purine catabolism regulatory protein